jgi:hypothetical protein
MIDIIIYFSIAFAVMSFFATIASIIYASLEEVERKRESEEFTQMQVEALKELTEEAEAKQKMLALE